MSEEKKQYEISFLVKTEPDKDAVFQALAQVNIISEGRFLEIKLAYPIAKQTVAYFGSVIFEAGPEDINEIDSKMKFTESVLRFLIVTPPPKKSVSRFAGQKPMLKEINAAAENVPENPVKKTDDAREEVDEAVLDEKLKEILK